MEKDLERMKELVSLINHYNKMYYTLDSPVVSDAEYDKLYYELADLEKKTGNILPNSPTQKVGDRVLSGFKKYKHRVRLYSLNKVNSFDELRDWSGSINDKFGNQVFTLEYKFDGLQMVLEYDKGTLSRAVTRGNGFVGEEVTPQIRTIRSVPEVIPFKDKLIVQGEVMMRLSILDKYNKTHEEPLKNARNAAAGAVRNLDPEVTRERNLDMVLYGVPYLQGKGFDSQVALEEFLRENGFFVSNYFFKSNDIEKIISEIEKMADKRESLDILIDGAVIKLNDIKLRESLGYTEKFPRWAVAYKFEAVEMSTILSDVVWQVGRTGKLTPIAEIEPVELAGATIHRATLNNMGDIDRKNVKIGSRVFVRRSNEVIPEILGVAEHYKTSKDVEAPKACPVCGSKITKIGANLFCTNKECSKQITERIVHYCTRNAMNIEGISDKTVELIADKLNIDSVADLYSLKEEDLKNLPSFKDKKTQNLIRNIERSKTPNFENFIYAIGIKEVGTKTARDLAKNFDTLEDLQNASLEALVAIDGVGDIVAQNIVDFFANQENKDLINSLLDSGIQIQYKANKMKENPNFTGKTIVLTGTLQNYTRDELKDILLGFGSDVVNSISSKTDLVILGENPGSKYIRAKELGIKIMEEAELLNKLK